MNIIGIDLSGPSNTNDTAACILRYKGSKLMGATIKTGLTDPETLTLQKEYGSRSIFALDAPLSYNPGGGMRERDRDLVAKLKTISARAGIMSPTMTKMAYLTLRGHSIARMLEAFGTPAKNILEVHPGASLLLHGAPADLVSSIKAEGKKGQHSREQLAQFLAGRLNISLPPEATTTSHALMAVACAHAAMHYQHGTPKWIANQDAPHHPYPFIA